MLLPKEGTSSVSFSGVEVATRIERNGMIVEMILLWGELLSRKSNGKRKRGSCFIFVFEGGFSLEIATVKLISVEWKVSISMRKLL